MSSMRRFFILLCALMLVAVGECRAQKSADDLAEVLFEQFSEYEGADGVKIGSLMMSMVRTFAKEDKEMTDEQRNFFNHIKRMWIVDLTECSAQDKDKFKRKIQATDFEGYTKIEAPDGVAATTFYHLHKGKVDIMIIAVYEKDAWSFSVFEGNFEQTVADSIGAAPKNPVVGQGKD